MSTQITHISLELARIFHEIWPKTVAEPKLAI